MSKTSLFAAVLVMAASGLAQAGGQAGSIGVGAEASLNGTTGGASVNYDAGTFHAGGFFGFNDQKGGNNTEWSIGGRFFYHVHSTAMSDFSLGGGLGVRSYHPPMATNNDTNTNVFLEPGAQIRLFLASNVAISATVGVVVGVADASGVVEITGQDITGGIHYYFF